MVIPTPIRELSSPQLSPSQVAHSLRSPKPPHEERLTTQMLATDDPKFQRSCGEKSFSMQAQA